MKSEAAVEGLAIRAPAATAAACIIGFGPVGRLFTGAEILFEVGRDFVGGGLDEDATFGNDVWLEAC